MWKDIFSTISEDSMTHESWKRPKRLLEALRWQRGKEIAREAGASWLNDLAL